jgi:type I restriction enzyme, S subunit
MTNGWQTKRFGDVCEFDKAQGAHRGLPYVGLEHIESHTARFIGSLEPQAVKSSTFRFSTEHVLYGRLRPYLNKALAPDFEGHCSTEIFPLKPSRDLSREYLLYWLLSDETVERINDTCTGARMPRADMNEVLDFIFPFPALPEQQRIVRILDEAFEGIATAKANAEKNLQNARALFESHLRAVFTQGGKGWVKKMLGDVCEATQGIQIPKSEQCSTQRPGYRRYLYISDFESDKNLKYVPDEYPKKVVTTEDIIVANTGSAGKIFRGIDGVLSNNLFKVSFDVGTVDRDFIFFFVTSGLFREYQQGIMRGTANPHMGHVNFKSTPITIPSIEAQKAAVVRIHEVSEETQRFESIYQRKLAALEELKKSLLHQAFTGQL